MKTIFLIPLVAVGLVTGVFAQERIYRCGNEYTNTVSESQAKNCKLVSGGNVTVVQAHKPTASSGARAASATQPGQRVDAGEQRAKDSDSRLILESELKKAEARHAELLKEYNNGEPEKIGGEARNYQKYVDRVAELKASISRTESDIAGIRRELGRVPAASSSSAAK
jgi:vacuolar-type H+-ATPase subunit I/STV1